MAAWLSYTGILHAGISLDKKDSPINSVVQQTARGVVTAADGTPIPGATVWSSATERTTTTNEKGEFVLQTSVGDILLITFIGYAEQYVEVTDNILNISLTESNRALDEIVVVGYGSQRRTDVTGSISSVDSEDFNRGVVTNPGQLLQGKVAGLNVSIDSGEPGASQDVIIRGVGSLRSGTTPLYVVDGFALDNTATGVASNPLNFINPNDIEKIDVLKDASAAAIYGARAANGVVVITTKKGKSGVSQINISGSTSISSLARKLDVFGADEFRSQVTAVGGTLKDGGANTDWQDVFTRNAFSKNVNLSVSGGSDRFSYFGSAGVDDQEGILNNSDLKRYSARLNMSQNAWNDRVKVSINLAGVRTENQRPLIGTIVSDMVRSNPTFPAYTDGEPTPVLSGDQFSSLIREQLYSDYANNNRILANITPSVEIIKGLVYKLNVGVDYSTTDRDVQNLPYAAREDEIGSLNLNYTDNTNTLIENYLTYELEKGAHQGTLLAGHTYQQTNYKLRTWAYEGFPTNGIEPRYQTEAATRILTNGTGTEAIRNELQSFFGRVNYSFADKYLLTATMRADGSSKFGGNNKYGYFPSVSAGWNIGQEDFMSNSPFNELKVRASWGRTGNQEIPSKITQASYIDSRADDDTYPLNDGVRSLEDYPYGIVFTRLANPDIQWEVSTQSNLGMDFSLLNHRVTGSVDFFNKVSENVLLEVVPADPIQPTTTYWTNIPGMEIKNRGVEVALEYSSDRSVGEFAYNVGGNFSFIKNEVVNSPYAVLTTGSAQGAGQTGSTINGYINNAPIGSFYMRELIGMDETGFSQFRDVNGDGQILDDDRAVMGKAIPDAVYAFHLNFFYRNFDLGLNFNGVAGNQIYNHTAMSNFTKGNLALSFNTTDKAIQYPTEVTNNTNEVSTRYLENGDFLRLNNATLGYNINPASIGLAGKVQQIRIGVTGQNLFVLTDYSGFDPELNTGVTTGEIQTFGIDYFTYPKVRSFVFSVNVAF